MIIAGLDAATTSGLCVLNGDQLAFAQKFRPPGETHAEIFHGFRHWLIEILTRFKVDHLGIEQPLPSNRGLQSSMNTFLLLYGLRAHAVEICQAHGIGHTEVNVRTWRQSVYGMSLAPRGVKDASKWWKQKALQRCKILGWPIESPDAAESALIADHTRATLNPRFIGFRDELFGGRNT